MAKRNIFYDKHARIKSRFFILSLVLALVLIGAGFGILKLSNMKTICKGIDSIVDDRVLPLQQLKTISDLYGFHIVGTVHKVLNGHASWAEASLQIEETIGKIPRMWDGYLNTYLTDEEKKLVDELSLLFAENERSLKKLTALLHGEDRKALSDFVQKDLYSTIDPIIEKIDALFQIQVKIASKVRDNEKLRNKFSLTLGTASIILSILLGVIVVLQRRRWRALLDSL